jgi:hypothetical protein
VHFLLVNPRQKWTIFPTHGVNRNQHAHTQLSQNLKRLSDEAAAAGIFVPASIETYYFPNATKDNFAGGASEPWDTIE